MRSGFLAILCLAVAATVHAETYATPTIGFARNIGQYDADILFGRDDNYFRASGVQVSSDVSIELVGALPTVRIVGEDALPHPLHFYLGPDSTRWRENAPHFSRVHYAGLYAGIDANWHGESLIFNVAPGADPGQILLRLHSARPREWSVYYGEDSVRTQDQTAFYDLAADESTLRFYRALPARFVQVDQNSFRVEVRDWDRSLPLTITMKVPLMYDGWYSDAVRPGYDGSALISGTRTTVKHGYLAKSAPNKVEFVSLIPANFLGKVAVGKDGSSTVGGTPADGSPVTPGEPLRPLFGIGWVGRFDPTGRLTAATVFDHRINDIAVDPAGLVYVATPEYIMRWIPRDSSRFQFPIAGATSLAVNSSGLLAWCAPRAPNQATLPGAFQARYEGLQDVFAGTIESSGRMHAATYVPVNGAPLPPEHSMACTVAMSPSGSIWISSEFFHWRGGQAQTLVALNPSGSRVIHSESLPALPVVSFDDRGNTLVAISSNWPNLPTVPGAPLRAPCGQAVHLRTLSPSGAVLGATYLRAGGRLVEFSGPDRLFVVNDQDGYHRIDPAPPVQPGIACLIHPAHRRLTQYLPPEALTTIVGNGLGPLEAVVSTADANGRNPTQLAGVQVLVNQMPVPLVSVQQGLITFYLPAGAGSEVQVQVRTPEGIIDGPWIPTGAAAGQFGLFTVDGSGWGPAAALNQDGSLNGPTNPARWGSVVSVFGAGPRPSFNHQVEYFGPAPGLAQGVIQVNLRLDSRGTTTGWIPIIISGGFGPRALVYVTP